MTQQIIASPARSRGGGYLRGCALVLFGGLGLWALASIALINAQDAAPIPRPAAPLGKEVGAIIGAVCIGMAPLDIPSVAIAAGPPGMEL